MDINFNKAIESRANNSRKQKSLQRRHEMNNSASSSIPSSSGSYAQKQTAPSPYASYDFAFGSYDFIDNRKGGFFKRKHTSDGYILICLGLGQTDNAPDTKNAKLISNKSEAMLVRNNKQIIYMPSKYFSIAQIISGINSVYVLEMKGDDITAEYFAKVEIVNGTLPIPENERNRLLSQLN